MLATVSIRDLGDGRSEVVIEYEDGHTVRMSVGRDSIVLRMHLGLDGDEKGCDSVVSPGGPHP